MRTRRLVPVLPVLALIVGACGGSGHSHSNSPAAVPGAPEVDVTASSFKFDPKTVTVKAGQPVTIALKSKDIEHDFTVDDLKIHVGAGPGKLTKSTVTPDKPGRYTFYCSVPGHRSAGMVGTLVVEP